MSSSDSGNDTTATEMPNAWKRLVVPFRKNAEDVIPFNKADPAKGEEQAPTPTVVGEDDPVTAMASTWMDNIYSRYQRPMREIELSAFVLDHWVPIYGVEATFEACLEICARLEGKLPTTATSTHFTNAQYFALINRLVFHVAAADPQAWSDLCSRVGDMTDASNRQRTIVAQCFPVLSDNVDSLLDCPERRFISNLVGQGVTTAAQLETLYGDGVRRHPDRRMLATLLDRFGPDLVPAIDDWTARSFKHTKNKTAGKDFAAALEAIGTADAIRVLFVHGRKLPTFAARYRKAAGSNPAAAQVGIGELLGTEHNDRAEAELEVLLSAEDEDVVGDRSDLPALLREPPWTRPTAIKLKKNEWQMRSQFDEPRPMLTVDHVPARLPKIPDFIAIGALTRPVTNDGVTLPRSSSEDVLTMFIYGLPYRGSPTRDLLLAELEPTSTAAMLRDLFRQWVEVGMPENGAWVMKMQRFGDDLTVEMLAEYIKVWPANGRTVKAKNAASELGYLGSDTAIATLSSLSKAIRSKRVRWSIDYALERIAEQRGTTREQLEDAFVPDFGLDANGTLELDLGDRIVTLFLDEQLRPLLREPDGTIRKTFPKPRSEEQKWQQVTAKGRFTRLRKEVKAVAKLQLQRLEPAMAAGRKWSHDEFRRTMVEHALMISLTKRLVWGVYDETGVWCFRVAEDGTYADDSDAVVEVGDNAQIGLVHPSDIDDAQRVRWSEILSDYELLQPFEQIARQSFTMTDGEQAATDFARFTDGREHEVFALLGLEKRGWERGMKSEAYVVELRKAVSGDRYISLKVDPDGIYAPHPPDSQPSKITSVTVSSGEALGSLTAAEQSELIRDLTLAYGATPD